MRCNGQHDLGILGARGGSTGPDRQLCGQGFGILGADGRLWRTEFSSVKKGRFSEDLSAFRGRTLGILGAHNPICSCTSPVVGCPLFVEMWEITRKPRRLRQGKS